MINSSIINRMTVVRDLQYAPIGFLVCRVIKGPWDVRDEENTVLVQSDGEFPALARTFGWRPCHNQTDGTVDCPVCGRTVKDLIPDAYDYLESHQGEIIDTSNSEYFQE